MTFPYTATNPVRYDANHPNDIPISFKTDYLNNVLIVANKESILRGAVDVKSDVKGQSTVVYDLEAIEMDEVTERYGDTNYSEPVWTDRKLQLTVFDKALLVPKNDSILSATDPESEYVKIVGYAAATRFDTSICAAPFARVYRDKDPSQYLDWDPVGNTNCKRIAHGNQSMTLAKIRRAKRYLDAAKVPKQGRHMALSSIETESLLADTKLQSVDYISRYTIENGELPPIYGFKMHETEEIITDTPGTVNRCFAWQEMGIKLGISQDVDIRIDVLPTKKYATQVYVDLVIGAIRRQEKYMVEIECIRDVESFDLAA